MDLIEQDRIKNLLIKFLNPGYFKLHSLLKTYCDIQEWHDERWRIYNGRFLGGWHIKLERFNPPRAIEDPFTDLMIILLEHKELFDGVYVHGSYADGGYVEGVSDLDMVYLISKKTINSPRKMLQLRNALKPTKKIFEEIDPGDHHGPYVMTRKMFGNYIESYLPIDVWKETKYVFGDTRLYFNPRKSEYHEKEWFLKSCDFYTDAAAHPERFQSQYEIKKFVMTATMIPAVAYSWATGEYTTKKKAIEWMALRYPTTMPWIKEMSRMREEDDFSRAPVAETLRTYQTIKDIG